MWIFWKNVKSLSLSPKQPKKERKKKKNQSLVFCSPKVPGGFQPRQPSLERILYFPSGFLAGRWEINTLRLIPSTLRISLKYEFSITEIDFIIEPMLCTVSLGHLSPTSLSLCCLERTNGWQRIYLHYTSRDDTATSGNARPAYEGVFARCYEKG